VRPYISSPYKKRIFKCNEYRSVITHQPTHYGLAPLHEIHKNHTTLFNNSEKIRQDPQKCVDTFVVDGEGDGGEYEVDQKEVRKGNLLQSTPIKYLSMNARIFLRSWKSVV
jgi:hypothetical protein